jgi:Na+/H+ antiporter NhaA
MALFIGGRALSGALLDAAKLGVMIGSALSAVVGMVLILGLRRQNSAGVTRAPDGVETD